MRFMPFSYFCTCWNVRPSAFPSFSWLIASICRRIRTRLPTCLSMEFVAFSPTTRLPRATRTFPHVSDIGDPQLGVLRSHRFWTDHISGADVADAPICNQEPTQRGSDGGFRQELAQKLGVHPRLRGRPRRRGLGASRRNVPYAQCLWTSRRTASGELPTRPTAAASSSLLQPMVSAQ